MPLTVSGSWSIDIIPTIEAIKQTPSFKKLSEDQKVIALKGATKILQTAKVTINTNSINIKTSSSTELSIYAVSSIKGKVIHILTHKIGKAEPKQHKGQIEILGANNLKISVVKSSVLYLVRVIAQ